MSDNMCMRYILIDLFNTYLLKNFCVSDGDKITDSPYLQRIHKIEKNQSDLKVNIYCLIEKMY